MKNRVTLVSIENVDVILDMESIDDISGMAVTIEEGEVEAVGMFVFMSMMNTVVWYRFAAYRVLGFDSCDKIYDSAILILNLMKESIKRKTLIYDAMNPGSRRRSYLGRNAKTMLGWCFGGGLYLMSKFAGVSNEAGSIRHALLRQTMEQWLKLERLAFV